MSEQHQMVTKNEENLPEYLDEADDMAGEGLQDPRIEELQTPFLYLLQSTSKAVMQGTPEYVNGAQVGMFINSVTKTLYSGMEGIEVIPCYREYNFIEWVPVEAGGGFKGTKNRDDPLVDKLLGEQGRFKKLRTDSGTDLVETFSIYALVGKIGATVHEMERVIIPFTSTKIKAYKLWFNKINDIRYINSKGVYVKPNIYQHRWKMTSVFDQKRKPNGTWTINELTLAGGTKYESLIRKNSPLFAAVKEFADLINSGSIKADYSKENAYDVASDEVPF